MPIHLSPSTIARYFFHSCEAFLVWAAIPDAGIRRRPDTSPTMRALQERGHAWERDLIQSLQPQVRIAPGQQPLNERVFTASQTLTTLQRLQPGEYLYQATLEAPPGALGLDPAITWRQPRPDLILRHPTTGRLQILDVKSATEISLTQKIQVWFYARLLQDMLQAAGIRHLQADLEEGAIWLGNAAAPLPFSLAELDRFLLHFLRVDLPRILTSQDDPFWALTQRCEWCDFHLHCEQVGAATRDLSRTPGLQPSALRFLAQQIGSRSVEAARDWLAQPEAPLALEGHTRLAGRHAMVSTRIAAQASGRAALTGAASLSLPTRQAFTVILLAVPDNLARKTLLLGYHTQAHSNAAMNRLPDIAPQALFLRDPQAWIQALHGALGAIAALRNPQDYPESTLLCTYSARERAMIIATLLEVLNSADADWTVREQALDLLQAIGAPDLVAVAGTRDQGASAGLSILAEEIQHLLAIPGPVSPRLDRAVAAIRVLPGVQAQFLPEWQNHRTYDYPYGLTISDQAITAGYANGAEALRNHAGMRLRRIGAALRQLQVALEHASAPECWAPPLRFAEGHRFAEPRLGQISFFIRYEAVSQALKTRQTRMPPVEDLMRDPKILRVALMEPQPDLQRPLPNERARLFRILTPEAKLPDAGLLVACTPQGREASIRWSDYGKRYFNPSRIPEEEMKNGPPQPLYGCHLEIHQDGLALYPLPDSFLGGEYFLFERHWDKLSDRLRYILEEIDEAGGTALTFLQDPAALAALPATPWPAVAWPSHILHEAQAAACQSVLERRLTCLIGPPGTGKTHTLTTLLRGLAETLKPDPNFPEQILNLFVIAPTNAALDEVESQLRRRWLLPRGVLIERLGGKRIKPPKGTWLRIGICTAFYLRKWAPPGDQIDLLIIDEASQMKLQEAMAAIRLVPEGGRILLVGDDQQMPPVIHGAYPTPDDGHDPDQPGEAGRPVFSPIRSVFSHALLHLPPGSPGRAALTQGRRMNDVLCSLARSLIYLPVLQVDFQPAPAVGPARLALTPAELPAGTEPDPAAPLLDRILDPAASLSIVILDQRRTSRDSPEEADLVARLLARLQHCLPPEPPLPDRCFIVAPHHVHIAAIGRSLAQHLPQTPLMVQTVEKVQGQQRDCVVVSYGVSDPEVAMAEADFIYDRNRLNVALSRARTKGILVLSRGLLQPSPKLLEGPRGLAGFEYLTGLLQATSPGEVESADLAGRAVALEVRHLLNPVEPTP